MKTLYLNIIRPGFITSASDFKFVATLVLLQDRLLVVCIWRHQRHDYANYDQFAPNFGTVYKTIHRVSVPNFNLFGRTKTDLQAKEVGEFYIILYGKMGW